MHGINVKTIDAELALNALAERYERGYGDDTSTPQSRVILDMYFRVISTDRGPYPTQAEFDALVEKYAPGLTWNDRKFRWEKAPAA